MRALVVFTILVFWTQDAASKGIYQELDIPSKESLSANPSHEVNFRGDNLRNAWNLILFGLDKTKTEIAISAKNIESKADNTQKSIKTEIEKLKKKLQDIIKNLYDTSESVKICLQKEDKEIEELVGNIAKNVTICILGNKNKAYLLRTLQYVYDIDDNSFITEIEHEIDECKKSDNIEECLGKIEKELNSDIQSAYAFIYDAQQKSRDVADEIIDAIIGCSLRGLIEASDAIALETLKIIQCMKESGKKEQ